MTYRRFLYAVLGFVGILGVALQVQALACLALGGAAFLFAAWRD